MTERGIIFSGSMVQAILDGRKTRTRRIIKPQPPQISQVMAMAGSGYGLYSSWSDTFRVVGPVWAVRKLDPTLANEGIECPCGNKGSTLWVRETWKPEKHEGLYGIRYAADDAFAPIQEVSGAAMLWLKYHDPERASWRSPIFMPRLYSRITLKITDVAAVPLCNITDEEAKAEGCESREDFLAKWDKINGKQTWELNPWVWAISFIIPAHVG